MHRRHYLHGYYEAVPLVALTAPLAQIARSTNRSGSASPSSRPTAPRSNGGAAGGSGARNSPSPWVTVLRHYGRGNVVDHHDYNNHIERRDVPKCVYQRHYLSL